MDRRRFLKASATGAALPVAGGLSAISTGANAASAPPKGNRVLIRDAYLVTMDPKLGELRGDLLMENGRIAAIGKDLKVSGAEVVDGRDTIALPGFIDTHRHTWQSAVRHIGSDWTFLQYLTTSFSKFGIHFRPQDVH